MITIKQDKNALKKNSISLLRDDGVRGGRLPVIPNYGPTKHGPMPAAARSRTKGAPRSRSGGMSIRVERPPLFLQDIPKNRSVQGAFMRPVQSAPGGVFLDNDMMIAPQAQHMRHGMLQGETRAHRIVKRKSHRGSLPIFEGPTPTAIERKAIRDQMLKRLESMIHPVEMPNKFMPQPMHPKDRLPLFTIT